MRTLWVLPSALHAAALAFPGESLQSNLSSDIEDLTLFLGVPASSLPFPAPPAPQLGSKKAGPNCWFSVQSRGVPRGL